MVNFTFNFSFEFGRMATVVDGRYYADAPAPLLLSSSGFADGYRLTSSVRKSSIYFLK